MIVYFKYKNSKQQLGTTHAAESSKTTRVPSVYERIIQFLIKKKKKCKKSKVFLLGIGLFLWALLKVKNFSSKQEI